MPRQALLDSGAQVEIISLKSGKIKGWQDGDWKGEFEVDQTVDAADAASFDALVMPGGVINPDKLRGEESVLKFVRHFFEASKPVAAICHGPQTLIDAGVLKGRKLTSYASIKNDLKNAGAQWVDEEVVVDNGLVTSRKPEDLPAFNRKMIEEIVEGTHSAGRKTTGKIGEARNNSTPVAAR